MISRFVFVYLIKGFSSFGKPTHRVISLKNHPIPSGQVGTETISDISIINELMHMNNNWQDYSAERKQLRSFKRRYLKSGNDIISHSELMKECREILNKGLFCSATDEEEKVQYSFDVLKNWEQLRFPGIEKLHSELQIDEYTEYYKAIEEGFKENDRFKMYFSNTFQLDAQLQENYPTDLNIIKQQMIRCVDTGMDSEKAIKKLNRVLKSIFLENEASDDKKFRYNSVLEQILDAIEKNPFMNADVKMTYQEKIGAKKIIKKLYGHLEEKEKQRIDRIKDKYRKKILKAGQMAKNGTLWLFTGRYFGFKVHQVDDFILFLRKKFWKNMRKFPVALVEIKEFNRTYSGLADYLILKSYVHRPIMKYKANRIFRKIDSNILPTTKYKAFEILLGNNKMEEAIRIKNLFKFSKGDLLNLNHDMENKLNIYNKYEELFS